MSTSPSTIASAAATPDARVGPAKKPHTHKRRRDRAVWWLVLIVGVAYFALPLIATLQFSLRTKVPFKAYTNVLSDSVFWSSLGYSALCAVFTIVLSMVLIVPTAYWVRLKVPRMRPVVEFITLLPFVIPPVVLVFGLIRVYSAPPLPLTSTDTGSNVLLVAGYVVLSLPYMYRSVDTGLRSIDIKSLTEAAQSLGAGWPTIIVRVILPNVRTAVLSGAFLTFAIVLGEFTIANYLFRPAFGPYLSYLGNHKSFEPAAVSLISFGLTWLAIAMIAVVGRKSRGRVTVVAVK
ncbi:MAG: ABC transporter permease [Chloroflexi bacterium]|nr:ABC transporter permease [Chloroflexota bacterium]